MKSKVKNDQILQNQNNFTNFCLFLITVEVESRFRSANINSAAKKVEDYFGPAKKLMGDAKAFVDSLKSHVAHDTVLVSPAEMVHGGRESDAVVVLVGLGRHTEEQDAHAALVVDEELPHDAVVGIDAVLDDAHAHTELIHSQTYRRKRVPSSTSLGERASE